MSTLDYPRALLLGAVQGVTEFLPISSSGHLAVVENWLDLHGSDPEMLLFNVLTHVGSLVAVLLVFRVQVRAYAQRLLAEARNDRPRRVAWRILGLGMLATGITAAIGLPFQEHFERAFGDMRTVGGALIITAAVLAGTRFVPRGRKGLRELSWTSAAIVGLAQAAAIIPGISRSGSTICAASYCGWRRRWSAEFSFLIAVPAILGGALKKMMDTFSLPAETWAAMPWGAVLVGSLVSLAVGVFALQWLVSAVRRGRLHLFSAYCLALGLFVLWRAA